MCILYIIKKIITYPVRFIFYMLNNVIMKLGLSDYLRISIFFSRHSFIRVLYILCKCDYIFALLFVNVEDRESYISVNRQYLYSS